MEQRLQDKNALVTGGSSGIGQAIAIRLAQEGANVAINYRSDLEDAQDTEEAIQAFDDCVNKVEECGAKVTLIQADVSKEKDVTRMIDEAISELGGLDILVNNAGIQRSKSSHEVTSEEFDQVINVNLRGAFLCARQFLQHALGAEKPGIILNVSSVHQIIPKPLYLSYTVSKGGMENLTKTLALEYAGRKIRVNAIGPGATVTPINRAWVDDPQKREEVTNNIPMGRAGSAEEMAAAAAFLCSDEAAYITGQTLYIDGGLTLYPDFREPWSSE